MLGLYLHTGAASQEERLKRELEHGCTPGAPDQDGEYFVVPRRAEGSVRRFKTWHSQSKRPGNTPFYGRKRLPSNYLR